MFYPVNVVYLVLVLTSLSETSPDYSYCIVGAGPGGLQLGYFLERAGRNYVIFEKSSLPGSFFVKYPRHRTLISINKRHTGFHNKEFNLRHDWNSLISDNETLLFRHYSREMFPHADRMVDYLGDYQRYLGIKVQFNTEIGKIRKQKDLLAPAGNVFLLNDQFGNTYSCRTLILATGLGRPIIPSVSGIEHAVGYEDVSTNPEDFEGKSVIIFGRGNSGFETASSIYGHSSFIHMIARSRMKLAWSTHYVGDTRAVNTELLDSYQLKSLDALAELELDSAFEIVPKDDKFLIRLTYHVPRGLRDNIFLRDSYDVVIRCLGFAFDPSLFANVSDMAPTKPYREREKYLPIQDDFQSRDNPGLYVTGTLGHALDYRKSAGGFIHGFRYTARALFRLLEWRNHGVRWPATRGHITQLTSHIVKRINEASAIYQMFSFLGDVIVFNRDTFEYDYFEEVPIRLLYRLENATGIRGGEVIVLTMAYGKNFSGPGKDVFVSNRANLEASKAHSSNFLHPVLYHYKTLPSLRKFQLKADDDPLPRPSFVHHMVEDFLTKWTAPHTHLLPLRRFLENVTQSDLRQVHADTCLEKSMTHTTVPLSCHDYLEGQGLVVERTVIELVKKMKTEY